MKKKTSIYSILKKSLPAAVDLASQPVLWLVEAIFIGHLSAAALGGVGYAIVFNTKQYRQSSYNYALQPDDTNERYLKYWRRNVELSYIGLILVYALQVLDAYVDAQLYSWDVNENLSLRIAPSMQPMITPASVSGHSLGFTCSIDFRRR